MMFNGTHVRRRQRNHNCQGKSQKDVFKKVQAFCEEYVLRNLHVLGVFCYAKSKNQCWQAEKSRLHYLNLHISKMAAKLKKCK